MSLGIIYNELGNYDVALDYHLKALEVMKTRQDEAGIAKTLNNIGISYRRLGDYDKALDYYQQALTIREGLGDKNGIFDCLSNMGSAHYFLMEYDHALTYYQRALQLQDDSISPVSVGKLMNNVGFTYLQLNDYKQAQQFKAKTIIQNSYENLSVLFREQGDYQKAYEYLKRFTEVKDDIKHRRPSRRESDPPRPLLRQ